MSDKRLKVIVTRRLPDAVELRLKELFDTELNQSDTAFSEEQLIDAVKRADVLVSTVTDQVDGKVLSHGGPWARDNYGYNGWHQWMANRGYAVLSVNYRGSTGFGKNFVNAAVKEFAGKMHEGPKLAGFGRRFAIAQLGFIVHRHAGHSVSIQGRIRDFCFSNPQQLQAFRPGGFALRDRRIPGFVDIRIQHWFQRVAIAAPKGRHDNFVSAACTLHGYFISIGKKIDRGEVAPTSKTLKMLNEVPFLIMIPVVILAIGKPF